MRQLIVTADDFGAALAVNEAVEEASRRLGWAVTYEMPGDIPHVAGMPRPVDVTVVDRDGRPVSDLAGSLIAIRPSDARLNQRGKLVAIPAHAGSYRTLIRIDRPGAWELRLDATQRAMRFVLSEPDLFLNTTSDATLLPTVLDVAARLEEPISAPPTDEVDADIERLDVEPIFDGDALERI